MVMSLSKLRELVMDREAWHAAGHGRKSRTWLSNWTDWTEHSLEGLMLKLKPPILWPPDVKNQLIGKDSNAGNDWGQGEKRVTDDEMVGWYHQLIAHEFEQAGRQWRTGRPGVLQFMGLQRVGHDLTTEQQNWLFKLIYNWCITFYSFQVWFDICLYWKWSTQ